MSDPTPQFELSASGFLADMIAINHDITSILDLDPLLRKIAEHTRRFVPYDVFAILLIDEAMGELYYRFSIGHPPDVVNTFRVPIGQGIIGTAAKERRTVVVDDVTEDSRYINVLPTTRSELALPLISKDRVIGVLDIESPERGYFHQEHVRVLNMLASQIAVAIENANLYESERRNREIISLLYDISLEVASTLDVEELIEKIATAVKSTIDYHIFSILLLDEATRILKPRMVFRHEAQAYEKFDVPIGKGLVGSAALENRPVRVGNVKDDPRYLRVHDETESELVIPLAFKGRMIGVLDLESQKPHHFTEYDERLLMTLATRVASALVNAELYEKVAESEKRMEQELAIAQEIQRQLLPKEIRPIGPLHLAVSFTPAAHLGGDHYDVIRFDDKRVAIAIGDVSGKGTPAALYAALAGGIIRTRAGRKYPPAEMLELVNKTLQQRPIASQYIALIYGIYDPELKQLTLANSGLPYPIHAHGDECTQLDISGIPLGLFPDSTYEERVLDMAEGDMVVLYTDGIVERRDSNGDEFGLRRLAKVVQAHRSEDPEDHINSIKSALDDYSEGRAAGDDQTIIVLKMAAQGLTARSGD
jgi:sigma-B regulation protein RsbU (phosphoserine phosphatase)